MGSLKSLEDIESFDDFTHKQWIALGKKLGGLNSVKALLRDEVEIEILEKVLKLFDKHGRRIPKDLENPVRDPDKDFYLVQPKLNKIEDYSIRLKRFLGIFYDFRSLMYAIEFQLKCQELIAEIKRNKLLVNLLNGVHLPIILPKLESYTDYGKTYEQVFLPAVKKAYEKQFPGRNFHNYRKGELANRVSIVEGSRYEKLIERMKQGILYGIYFPNPLQGFSILAAREQMNTLPGNLLLAGGFDTCVAMAMYPDVLARDYHTPAYDLSAFSWRSPDYSLYFKAYDDRLNFGGHGPLSDASDRFSPGLLLLG